MIDKNDNYKNAIGHMSIWIINSEKAKTTWDEYI